MIGGGHSGREEEAMPQVDSKYVGGGLAAIGMLFFAATGYLTITTPEAQQCAVDLAAAEARLELIEEAKQSLEDAKDACKDALKSCAGASP
jgi:hypothetical protein